MIASERLKALLEERNGYFDVGHSSDYVLVDALPELIAVVKRAEFIQSYHHSHRERADECTDELCVALAALDAKLTTEERPR